MTAPTSGGKSESVGAMRDLALPARAGRDRGPTPAAARREQCRVVDEAADPQRHPDPVARRRARPRPGPGRGSAGLAWRAGRAARGSSARASSRRCTRRPARRCPPGGAGRRGRRCRSSRICTAMPVCFSNAATSALGELRVLAVVEDDRAGRRAPPQPASTRRGAATAASERAPRAAAAAAGLTHGGAHGDRRAAAAATRERSARRLGRGRPARIDGDRPATGPRPLAGARNVGVERPRTRRRPRAVAQVQPHDVSGP